MRSIYVAGPMSGLPQQNYAAFHGAAQVLRAQGWLVENPADIAAPLDEMDEDETWRYYMRLAIPMLLRCDAIAFLPGWRRSRGACLEARVAHDLGYDCYTILQDELVPMDRRDVDYALKYPMTMTRSNP